MKASVTRFFVQALFLFLMSVQDSSEESETHFDLIPQVESLHQRCVSILKECKAWDEKKTIEGLHRYTNSLNAEMHFIEKVS